MRRKGAYEEIGPMLMKVFEYTFSRQIPITGFPVFLSHEITVEEVEKAEREKNADIEVAVPIEKKVEVPKTEEIKCYELPGGTMAKIVHKGPYPECTPTYEKLFAWIEANGKKIVSPTREVYLNDPRAVSPEELLTEIYAPLG